MNRLKTFGMHLFPYVLLIALAYPMGTLSDLGFRQMVIVTLLLIFQNASFTIVSRARQSANLKLHALAAMGSNGFFIFIITTYAAHYDNLPLKFWYIVCTVIGSVHAHYISLHKIEQSKAFKKDSLITRAELAKLEERLKALEGQRDEQQPLPA